MPHDDFGTAVEFNKLIARVTGIVLSPRTEWPRIAGEQTSVADLYKGYLLLLAAIPAVFAFVKGSVIGITLPFVGMVRLGIRAGLSWAILGYVLTLACFYVIALIIDVLAPSFGATRDRVQAFKTIVYAYTATAIAGVAVVLPFVAGLIVIVAGIYGIYLLYIGLPHTMKCPPDRAGGYTAVIVLASVVLFVVVGAVASSATGVGTLMRGAESFVDSDEAGDVKSDEDSPADKLEQRSRGIEEASKQEPDARQGGDQARSAPTQQMPRAAPGGDQVASLAPERLEPFLPELLGGMTRSASATRRSGAVGMPMTEARATYMDDEGRSWELQITDTAGAKGALALAGWDDVAGENQTPSGYEKTYREHGRLVHEQWDRMTSHGEYGVVLGERFVVKIEGQADNINDLKAALTDVELDALESLSNEGGAKP